MSKKIKAILLERDMTIKELSGKRGRDASYMYNKLARDRFTETELKKIANALDCDYDGVFLLSGKTENRFETGGNCRAVWLEV